MTYFTSLPETRYLFGKEKSITAFQNLSIYADLIDDIKDSIGFYREYYIRDHDRPDQLSMKMYGSPEYYWTFFLMNDNLRLQGWPLDSQKLEEQVKKEYPNTILTSLSSLKGIFKVDSTVTGLESNGSTSVSGKLIRRNLDLGQLVIKGTHSYSTNYSISDGTNSIAIIKATEEYNAIHHYVDSNSKRIDINPESSVSNSYTYSLVDGVVTGSAGSAVTPVTIMERAETENEKLKHIRIIKPEAIESIAISFKKLLRL